MGLDTNLNVAPYFDDFDETKHYHRILFKPSNAVQTRELNQIQSILQNQIERFASGIYKDGTIISGCGIGYYTPLNYARVVDHAANGALLDVSQFVGKTIESAATGLKGQIVATKPGSEQSYPWTNRVYVQYLNSGTSGNTQVQTFQDAETLTVYDNPRSSNVVLSVFNTFVYANTANTSQGTGYGVSVTSGMIYQKGFFITSDAQTVVVSDSVNPGNSVVGFITNESIISAEQDSSLYDNALGYANPTAPGADRLKLSANLTVISANDLSSTSGFTNIVQFIGGIPVIENSGAQYSSLGDELKKRSFETNGSFVIKPFKVNTVSNNALYFTAQVAAGSGYAQGARVELLKTAPIDIRRGVDTDTLESQLITTNYGNYVLVNEMSGSFDFDNLQSVDIYDTPQQSITKHTFASTILTGNKIGTATLRCVKYSDGIVGSPTCNYEFYIFNVQMNAGKNFGNQAKSIAYNGSAVGDLVFINGSNLFNSERRAMIWKFGTSALKTLKDSSNNINTQYVVRHRSTSTMAVDGTISLTLTTSHAGGTNQFPYGIGVIGGAESDFTVVLQGAAQSNTVANVSVNGTTVTGSGFASRFSPTEYILVGSDVRRIVSVNSDSSMTVDAPFSASNTAIGSRKYFPAGYSFPLIDTMVGTRTVNVSAPNSLTINTGASIAGSLSAPVPVSIYHNILRSNAIPAKKTINKGIFVTIDTSTHPAGNIGPWSLGLTDVHQVTKVAVDASLNPNASDLSSLFYFDTGMRDTHYDIASLYLKPGSSIPAGSKMVIQLDVFTPDTSPGIGFFSVDSYPVNDSGVTPSTITTSNIPTYISDSGTRYNLRDCIDFRPYKTNIATLSNTFAGASLNPPSVSNTFNIDTAGTYVPAADATFEADLTYYLGRKDMIYFSNRGYVKVREGVSSINPISPDSPNDGMGIAVLNIPPFPSLAADEVSVLSNVNRSVYNTIRDISNPVGVSIITNKRYRMQDIAQLDKRIARMEYYTALNALEQATTALQVSDSNGLNRFKNGIFVDPFNDFTISDVSNPEYRIAIDSSKGIARPFYDTHNPNLAFDLQSSSSIVQNSRLLTLPFTTVPFISQGFATNFRSCASVQYRWTGQIQLFPTYGNNVDKVAGVDTSVTLDLATPWQQFANSPFGMNWGDWQVSGSSSSTVSSVAALTVQGATDSTGYDTTTTTTTTYSRDGTQLGVGTSQSSYNLGSYVEDVSVQPYIASSEIAFYAWGIRPSTTLHAFFDDQLMDAYCAPGVRNTASNDTTSSNYVTRTAAYGTPLVSDANGTLYGKFLIPAATFRTGERTFKLSDVKLLAIGAAAATTSASATYTSSNISVTTGSTTLTTVNPTLSFSTLHDSYSTTTVSTTTGVNTVAPPPPPPPPPVTVSNPNPVTQTQDTSAPVGDAEAPVLPPDPPPAAPATITYPCGATFLASDVYAALANINASVIPGAISMTGRAYDGTWNLGDLMGLYCYAASLGLGGSNPAGDPISQLFTIDINNGVTGLYVKDLTLYFATKPQNTSAGVTVYICEVKNGYPDTTKTIPFSTKYLTWNQVNVSDTGQTGTTFSFEAPVFLNNGAQYAFVTVPDGGDPDYTLYTAVLGNNDIFRGTQVSSKPYVDTAFYSSNQSTWTALQDEFIKFDMTRCSFTATNGTASFNTAPTDYFNISGVVNANSSLNIAPGDTVVGANSSGMVLTALGKVQTYYVANGFMEVASSTGQFAGLTQIQIHRPGSDTTPVSANTLVASANVASIVDIKMNAIVPRFATIQPSGTTMSVGFRSCSNTYAMDGGLFNANFDVETEMFDFERIVPSRTTEVSKGGAKLMNMQVSFKSDSAYMSPALDLIRSNFLAISNIIDPTSFDITQEYTNTGAAKTKYVSQVVTLASGQDSEDLQIYLTAFRPLGSDVKVFAKFLNGEDPDTIINKPWTPMIIDDNTVYSDYRNVTDYRELMFMAPAGNIVPGAPATSAYVDSNNGLTYTSSTGSSFTSFKSFQIKIVLLSDSTALVPRLDDVRALAMLL